MAITQAKSKRSPTGKRYTTYRGKRRHEIGRSPSLTKLSKKRLKNIKTRGNNLKLRLLSIDFANVLDKKTNKHKKEKILSVEENPANRHFVRRYIITKGTIIKTESGKARVVSRPGQDGVVNAVLV